ncbi:MAG TPA: copper chaperone PCu(A)C [Sphingomonas sp.]|nr:copper chaperone PCu(A)C [Sphingomonas sp.]
MRAFAPIAAMLIATGCQQHDVTVEHPWVRLSAVPANPSAAYFTLKGGAKDETLTAVAAPAAQRAEMHESMGSGGMMTMTPVKLVAVRAGDSVEFKPGGKHVMLFGLNPAVKPGTTTPLILTFASGRTATVKARIVGAGDPAPGD